VFVASRSGLRRCVLSPGWCYRHQSDLAAMGKHAFRWLAPHWFSLAVTILLYLYRVDMCVVYAGRGRMRSKNIVSDAQVSPAGRTNVREIVIEIVQIKQYMSAYCLAPLQVDSKLAWVSAGVCGVPLSNKLL
jgi:hypothetical protein